MYNYYYYTQLHTNYGRKQKRAHLLNQSITYASTRSHRYNRATRAFAKELDGVTKEAGGLPRDPRPPEG